MSFTGNAVEQDMEGLLPGEIIKGHVGNTDAFLTFEDGLVIGRFAKLDTGSLDNLDGSATPTIVGVVGRSITKSMDDTTYTTALYTEAPVHNFGYITVEIPNGVTPAKGGLVYAENQTPSEYGKATTVSGGNVAIANATFHRPTNRADVWVVKLGSIL